MPAFIRASTGLIGHAPTTPSHTTNSRACIYERNSNGGFVLRRHSCAVFGRPCWATPASPVFLLHDRPEVLARPWLACSRERGGFVLHLRVEWTKRVHL